MKVYALRHSGEDDVRLYSSYDKALTAMIDEAFTAAYAESLINLDLDDDRKPDEHCYDALRDLGTAIRDNAILLNKRAVETGEEVDDAMYILIRGAMLDALSEDWYIQEMEVDNGHHRS